MMHQEVIFDMAKRRIGVVQANCPEYRDRPSHDVSLLKDAPGTAASPGATRAPTAAKPPASATPAAAAGSGAAKAEPPAKSSPTAVQQPVTKCWRAKLRKGRGSPEKDLYLPGREGDTFKIGTCLNDALPTYELGTHSCQALRGQPGRTIRQAGTGVVVGWAGCCKEPAATLGHAEFGTFAQCAELKAWQKRLVQRVVHELPLDGGDGSFVDYVKRKWEYIEDDPLRFAATIAALVFVGGWTVILLCCACVACCGRKDEARHTRLKDVEECSGGSASGLGPDAEVVGKVAQSPSGPEAFEIGDDDDGDMEMEPMDFNFDISPQELGHRSPYGRQPVRHHIGDDDSPTSGPQE